MLISVKTSVLMSTSVECIIGSKPKSLIAFSFYDVYYGVYFSILQGFLTFNKSVAIHKIMEESKIIHINTANLFAKIPQIYSPKMKK